MHRKLKVVVIGGGLAGISAALILSEAGVSVELFEQSGQLGGRASSSFNRSLGIEIDRGHHVLLGCCTGLLDLYRRIEALPFIDFCNSYVFADSHGSSTLTPSRLPEPFHLMPSLMGLKQLSLRDKLNSAGLIRRAGKALPIDLAASEWLASAGQSKRTIANFWEPILTAALNETLDRASARHAALVIRQAMLANREGYPMGISRAPLSRIHNELTSQALKARGVDIRLREPVRELCIESGRVSESRTHAGSSFAHYFVIATNPGDSPLIPVSLLKSASGATTQFKPVYVPIVTLYAWFRDKLDIPRVMCMPGGRFHWCFNKIGCSTGPSGMDTSLALVASASRDLMVETNENILKIGVGELRSAVGAGIPDPDLWTVVKYANATFSPFVGCDDVRPLQTTDLENVFLAGEWTSTGWPGTMESAVRSGYRCAEEILKGEGIFMPALCPRQ